jgi:hypothetical protein
MLFTIVVDKIEDISLIHSSRWQPATISAQDYHRFMPKKEVFYFTALCIETDYMVHFFKISGQILLKTEL